MTFSPIAIVGQACVLPGALTPEQLWQAVLEGRDLIGPAPEGFWRVSPEHVLAEPEAWVADRTWSDRGGYVQDFEDFFDPEEFALAAEEILAFDTQLHWVLHAGREALRQASGDRTPMRAGLVLGSLAYPTFALTEYAEEVWREQNGLPGGRRPHPRNRFHSGSMPHLAAAALRLHAGAFALDAACASSLYALKIACDRLNDGSADLMLAGGVNRTDDLLIHVGFSALRALSRSGRSRPFHAEADGLVPAEGAALVALKRLEDAEDAGDKILGVIRGVGLSNDGRCGGFLSPSAQGQTRAMRQAYEQAGLDPRSVSLVECHATGTQVGDGIEAQSLGEVFAGATDLPVGSLKSNLGHLITAAGAAGLLKVLAALRTGVRPPTRLDGPVRDDWARAPVRVLRQPEPWECDGPRRAAVSAFGFGGTNAHLLIEEWQPRRASRYIPTFSPRKAENSATREEALAVVGLAVEAGSCANTDAFAGLLFGLAPAGGAAARIEEVVLDARTVCFPPRDLASALPQQLLILKTTLAATAGRRLPPATGVFVGMQCDAEIARRTARLRVPAWIEEEDNNEPGDLPGDLVTQWRDAFAGPTNAAVVIGSMPNIPASRLSVQLDVSGPSFTVAAEELSGIRALEMAARGLRAGEIDAAVVGAVDLCCEPVHAAAAAAVLPVNRQTPGDAAVVLVLKRLDDARRDGDAVLAVLDGANGVTSLPLRLDAASPGLTPWLGHAHAASGLLLVAEAVLALQRRLLPVTPGAEGPCPWQTGPRRAAVQVTALGGQTAAVHLREDTEGSPQPEQIPLPVLDAYQLRFPAHYPPVVLPSEPRTAPCATRTAPAVTGPRLAHAALRRQRRVFEHFLCQQQQSQNQFLSLRAEALRLLVPGKTPSERQQPAKADGPRGPSFDREQLEVLATGKVSQVFGPLFEQQDDYPRQVRLPAPPLLLVDRVTSIDAEPGVAGQGAICTETDVRADGWYLHHGVMPAGLMIEAGQADLTLISWMGADFENRGKRVYRLLGCDLTYHDGLARPGDTLRYDIHIDGHARHGSVRLFFFHYDCRVKGRLRMTVRNGQAGFFTDQELAGSGGVLWSAETGEHAVEARVDAPAVAAVPHTFDTDQVAAYFREEAARCFGPGYEMLHTHTRTPLAGANSLQLFDEVSHCDERGGPWGRGYLRARLAIKPTSWFFDGHFKGDPCMPGTLMFEGGLQAMAFYLTALGYTLDRDGWRFEPVPKETYRLRCRGQVTPASRELVYELFVEEAHGGPEPVLYADLLCTVDGLKAFHCRRMALRLVPDWPLSTRPAVSAATEDTRPFAVAGDVRGDYAALLACAWGRPSDAFGSMYRPFDVTRRAPRLPGPPYHFMSRITRIDAEAQVPRAGASIEAEYDVPTEAWYFDGQPSMPFCVLLEMSLQPCGWLATYLGFTLRSEEDLFFRNLDGTGSVSRGVPPGAGTLRTRVTFTKSAEFGGLVIVHFETASYLDDHPVCQFKTSFGFFSRAALDRQVGLPPGPAERQALEAACAFQVDLSGRPARYFGGPMKMVDGPGRMIDRLTGYWPEGGRAGLGRLRCEQTIDPAAWYFKAHFYQDPVQAGSLGVEAMLQLLQLYLIERGLHEGIANPVFEPMTVGQPVTWKYRGQVVPGNARVEVELEVVEVGRDERGPFARADAWLWVDGLRIYHAQGLGMRIVAVAPPRDQDVSEFVLDPEVDGWLKDHRPTFTLPAAPLTWMADVMARAAQRHVGGVVLQVEDLQVRRWLICDRPRRLQVCCRSVPAAGAGQGVDVVLSAWREASSAALSRFEPVASARVVLGASYPPTVPPSASPVTAAEVDLPYESCAMFHGPAFRVVRRLWQGDEGATALLDAGTGGLPVGVLHPALLDGLWHPLTRATLRRWLPDLPPGVVLLPACVESLDFFAPTPATGEVRCDVRLERWDAASGLAWFSVEMTQDDRVWMQARVAERLFPLGPFAGWSEADTASFMGGRFVAGLGLSRHEGGVTRLATALVREMDWLPGTLACTYRVSGDLVEQTRQIAIKEHVARPLGVHPADVVVGAGASASCAASPGVKWTLEVCREGDEWVVRG